MQPATIAVDTQDYVFEGGFPTPEAARRAHDDADFGPEPRRPADFVRLNEGAR